MSKPKPIDKESPFSVNELFFSTTDTHGVIGTGNSVFVRVSCHSKESLVGAPHNIIRHPDMPKVVFKLLWDTIQAGKPIGAYVKNMAKTGAYYWVFACVFPIKGGYLSVRLKPTTPILDAVKDIYAKALAEEKRAGVAASGKLLMEMVAGAGFPDYETFMTRALVAELTSREAGIAKLGLASQSSGAAGHNLALDQLVTKSTAVASQFSAIFDVLGEFSGLNRLMSELISGILSSFRSLRTLSINMSLSSNQIGRAAATLTVIAENFQKVATEIQHQLASFEGSIHGIQTSLRDSEFQIASSRLQVEMTTFFIKEVRDSGRLELETAENCQKLVGISQDAIGRVDQVMCELKRMLTVFHASSVEIETAVTGLELIRQTGKIEATRIPESTESIDPHIESMRRIVEAIRVPMRKLSISVESLVKNSEDILLNLEGITRNMAELERQLDRACRAFAEGDSPTSALDAPLAS